MSSIFAKNMRQNYLIALAVKHDLWVKNTGPWVNEDGVTIPNRWEPCDRSDPDARPDLNSATQLMYEKEA